MANQWSDVLVSFDEKYQDLGSNSTNFIVFKLSGKRSNIPNKFD